MLRSRFSLFLLLTVFMSCYRPSQQQAFEDMKILEGTWTSAKGAQFSETWEVLNDSVIRGTGFSLNNGDTVFSEQLRIYRSGNGVMYAAKPGDRVDYVHFRLEKAGRNNWTFVNPLHDYPNVIEYRLENEETLIARTSNSNGNKVIEFYLKRAVR